MKWHEIKEAVGRITKQNQTVDVGADEIKKQAAKFGNRVDRDGRPPTMSKQVKGSSTNVLYNLGLAESTHFKESFDLLDDEDLAEIDKLQGRDFTVSKWVLDREYPYSKIENKTWPLPGGSGLVYHTRVNSPRSSEILIADPKKEAVVGFLELKRDKSFPIDDAHRVLSIGVDPKARGQGVAKSLYGIYLSMWGYPLLAGEEQTPGGRRNWLSLARIPGVEIKGFVTIKDQWFDTVAKMSNSGHKTVADFDEFLDAIMKLGGEYIGEEQGVHYFAFDVMPGSGELKPVVAKTLKVYYGEFDNKYDVFGNTGLYAIWKGN